MSDWTSFLKSISSFSGDVSSLTAPPFILSGTSLVEYSAYWVSNTSLLTRIPKEPNAEKRAALVLLWFLSTLKQQYSSRSENLGTEKKPLNPFLGELFIGKWDGGDEGDMHLVSEQVSHHPPVTAYSIWNEKSGVELQGYNGQKASVSRSLSLVVKQVGHALLKLNSHDETYLITLPSLHIEGLISGAPYVELDRSSSIVSSTGYTAKIDYSGKGWLSGKKNSFTGTLYKSNEPKKALFAADGQWTGAITIRDASKTVVEKYDPAALPGSPLLVANIEHQGPLESRRAWQKVAEAIKTGDMEATQKEKGDIENAQRELRKKEKEDGTCWERKFFKNEESDEEIEKMLNLIGESAEPEKTGGIWTWNGKKE